MFDQLKSLFAKKPVVLELDLARGILETKPKNPLEGLRLLNATSPATVRTVLEEAAKHDNVKGLIVHAAGSGISATTLEDVALEIEKFAKKKSTVAWTESFGELEPSLSLYKMATACQEIWVHPTGMLTISGGLAQIMLLKGGLNKIGIDPQFGQRHEYKTAANTYAADEITPAHREMMQSIVDAFVADAVATIARRRGISAEVVRTAIESSPIDPAMAKELGLIDHVGYRDEVYAKLLGQWNADGDSLRYLNRYLVKPNLRHVLDKSRKKIGVVNIHGGIVTGRGNRGVNGEYVGSDLVDERLRLALRDDSIVAVVLDVDSPGGSAVASDFIRRSVLQLKEAGKKVVARMGSVAASGGYYVSMAADEIVALPSTLTGSIGVLGGKMVLSGLYDKLGLVVESVAGHDHARMMSPVDSFTEEDWKRLNEWLDKVYREFTTFAAEDRGMEYEKLEALARGRVWTGTQALEHGLVDSLGGPRHAIERCAALVGKELNELDLVPLGEGNLLSQFRKAYSSQSVGSANSVPQLSVEAFATQLLRKVGLQVDGILSMPIRLELR